MLNILLLKKNSSLMAKYLSFTNQANLRTAANRIVDFRFCQQRKTWPRARAVLDFSRLLVWRGALCPVPNYVYTGNIFLFHRKYGPSGREVNPRAHSHPQSALAIQRPLPVANGAKSSNTAIPSLTMCSVVYTS